MMLKGVVCGSCGGVAALVQQLTSGPLGCILPRPCSKVSKPSSERARNENVATSFVHDVSRSRNVATTVPTVTPEGGTCVTFSTEPIVVTPDAAKQHSELYPGHRTTPRSSSKRPHFLLDVPLHRLLDCLIRVVVLFTLQMMMCGQFAQT